MIVKPDRPARAALRALAVAGLALDAYVHLDLAGRFAAVGTGLTQADLFRLQAGAALAAALLVAARGRRLEAGFGLVVAGAALGAVLLYRYTDPGPLGPIPDMYDPGWYPEKTLSALAEAVAVAACTALVFLRPSRRT